MSTFKNFVQCRVTTPITAVADSIGLYAAVSPYALPSEEGGLLVLTDSPTKPSKLEVISYTSRSALGLYGVTRGLEGTTAQAWTGPVYCYQSLLAGEFKTLLDSKVDIVTLGTAATKDVGTGTGNVMQVGAFGFGAQNTNNTSYDVNDLPAGQRISLSDGLTEANAVAQNLPALGGSGTSSRSWHVECVGRGTTRLVQTATEVYGVGTFKGRTFTRVKHDAVWYPWQEVYNSNHIVETTGTSTTNIMSQKAVTDQLATKAPLTHTHPVDQVTGLGTAATKNVGTSAGNVMEVGAFGWGASTETPISMDANLCKISGVYQGGAGAINFFPLFGALGTLIVTRRGSQIEQLNQVGAGILAIRNSLDDGVTWSEWVQMYHTGNLLNIGTTPEGARTSLELGTAATADLGTTAGTAAQGNDSRIVNSVPNSRTITAGTGLTGGGTLAANRTLNISYGTTAGTSVQGNDSRVVNALQKDNNLSDITNTTTARSNLGLGTAAQATLTTSNTDGTVGRVLTVGDGGWMGRGESLNVPYGYPATLNDDTNKTKVIRAGINDNGVPAYASGIHFAASDTWGRLRVSHSTPRAWIQGGHANTATGWTAELYHSDNLLNIGTTAATARSALGLGTAATTNLTTIMNAIANIPSVPKSAAYTVSATDKGASIDTTTNVTIPASVFAVGDVIVVTNTSATNSSITPAGGVTIRLAGTTSTGTRTLAGYGVATLRMASNNVWFASGAGLS